MHNIKDIRNNPNLFKDTLKKRFLEIDLKNILELDENNRKLIQEKEILEQESLIITIEAGCINPWDKYTGNNGISLGINRFGKSAPYKEVYNHFDLTSNKIVALIQKMLRK